MVVDKFTLENVLFTERNNMTKLKDLIPKQQPTFYVMVGIPGSGKSTTIKKIQQQDSSAVVVCPDEYRKQLGGTYNHFKDDKKIWNTMCPTDVKSALESGQSVIFDATNVAAKRRKSILHWAGDNVHKVAVVVEVDAETAKKQNRMREPDKVVPDHVIDRMLSQFQYPDKSEGFDEVVTPEEL